MGSVLSRSREIAWTRRSVLMASYCPHCGAAAPEEARFCMKCGKERLPEPE
ncbi:zinc ribbon domain-containing protein, partial [Streptomyces flavofungini]|uniref:zinc ribbon domain-containing protein n=1 Tax=Streptomyces flavofungini TaxID=68200 RepID=UPI0034DE3375